MKSAAVAYKNRNTKVQPSLTPAFDNNLHAFLQRKIPCGLFTLFCAIPGIDPALNAWLDETAKNQNLIDCLKHLYTEFGILPAPVLLILATTMRLIITRPRPLDRDSRQRRQDTETLTAALDVVNTYDASSLFLSSDSSLLSKEGMEQSRIAKNYLEVLKRTIGRIKRRKQADVEMCFCAQTLREFFYNVTVGPQTLDEYVSRLLVYAFNWPRGKGDPKLAALQRAKGPSIIAKRLTLQEALDLQKQDPGHSRFWREKKKELSIKKLYRDAANRRKQGANAG